MSTSEAPVRSSWDDDEQSLHDQADQFEDDLRAEMIRTGVIAEW